MKIFVTGRRGFIAKNLIQRLEKEGHAIKSSSQGDPIVDLLTEFSPEIIIHLATEGTNPDKMMEGNILLTHTILEYCRTHPIKKLLVFGSSSEYGKKTHPLTEKDTLDPHTIYEGTKACSSLLAQSYAYTYKIPTVLIRPLSIYGPNEKSHRLMTRVFSNTLKCMNDAYHDWTYIDDFINATVKIIEYDGGDVFDSVNIGLGIQRSNHEVIQIAEKLMGRKIQYTPTEKALGQGSDSFMWVCDPAHLITKYGFTPTITLEEGMRLHYEWFTAQETP
jgi:nucleoside-diphosphate-sugar epimerase